MHWHEFTLKKLGYVAERHQNLRPLHFMFSQKTDFLDPDKTISAVFPQKESLHFWNIISAPLFTNFFLQKAGPLIILQQKKKKEKKLLRSLDAWKVTFDKFGDTGNVNNVTSLTSDSCSTFPHSPEELRVWKGLRNNSFWRRVWLIIRF